MNHEALDFMYPSHSQDLRSRLSLHILFSVNTYSSYYM